MKRLLIYYGWPSKINGAADTKAAAAEFARYDELVLGAGLEQSNHPDREATAEILALLAPWPPRVYGYIDLGVTTSDLSPAAIDQRIAGWNKLGVDGIFYDDAGPDFGVDIFRLRDAITTAHYSALKVCVNAWDPQCLYRAGLLDSDAYLAESFAVKDGLRVPWRERARLIRRYSAAAGVEPWAVATGPYTPRLFRRGLKAAQIAGFDSFGWGEPTYSADSQAPYRPRPGEPR